MSPATPLGVLRAAGRSNHVVSDRGLRLLLDRHLTYGRLQDAALPIVVVATEVATGREIVLRDASAADAAARRSYPRQGSSSSGRPAGTGA